MLRLLRQGEALRMMGDRVEGSAEQAVSATFSGAGVSPAYGQRFASALESFVRDNPYRIFNFYDLWES
ncbi:MAG: hypothetical protein LBP38_01415 [Desulfovibrio sp.]|nr:hypothetical protein [Desulfovibrio sp.]